jgi:succinate dehydrogenase flavin-adding protein (antitoxin of CptAB toxin-antitoxin module)
MLELDLLLSDFLDNRFLLLPQSDQQDFVRLLNFPDQILLQWLFGNEQEVESDMQSIVKIIRQQGMDHAEQD